jgi:hypothetical protein
VTRCPVTPRDREGDDLLNYRSVAAGTRVSIASLHRKNSVLEADVNIIQGVMC